MKTHVLLALSLLLSLACSNPRYAQALTEENSQGSNTKIEELCQLRFEKSDLCVNWRWEEVGNSSDEGSIVFKIFRQSSIDKFPIVQEFEFNPSVILWMPDMGHGSSKTQISKLDTGVYRASKVFFVMPGAWEIKFRIYDGKGNHEDAVVAVSVD